MRKILRNVPTLRFKEFRDSWDYIELGKVCSYRKEHRHSIKSNYISTENLLSNFNGVERFASKEVVIGDGFNVGDVLFSNIRPYLKKVWYAKFDGVCNADVLVLQTDFIQKSFLYYLIANDKFINYVMSAVKGSKMPRGDKKFIMGYKFSVPTFSEQEKITNFLAVLDERIRVQNKIIESKKSLILSFVIEILFSVLSLVGSIMSFNIFPFISNLLKLIWTIFKEVKRIWSKKKT